MTSVVGKTVGHTRLLLTLAALLLVSGCDGGLFGTGDGGNVIDVDAGAPVTELPPAQTPQMPGTPTDGTGTEDQAPTVEFDNLISGQSNTAPVIALLNTSSRPLNISRELNDATLFTQAIEPGSFSEPVAISPGDNFLDVLDAQSLQRVFSIRPLNAGESSVTTLIARVLSDQTFDVVTLRTLTLSSTPTVAQVRIVQSNLLDETDTPATITLQPAGTAPGNAEVLFANVAASSASQASYQTVGAGSYQLLDSLARFQPAEITVEEGEIYTLVITSTQAPVLIVQRDTDLLDPP